MKSDPFFQSPDAMERSQPRHGIKPHAPNPYTTILPVATPLPSPSPACLEDSHISAAGA